MAWLATLTGAGAGSGEVTGARAVAGAVIKKISRDGRLGEGTESAIKVVVGQGVAVRVGAVD